MEFQVTLDQFEGPLDLMLHLVIKNKLDLFDLNLDLLTRQYLEYIQAAQSLNLEVSSEYLEECTRLMEYKSRRLLPAKPQEEEDDFQEDPAAQLAARLTAYALCQKQAAGLDALFAARLQRLDREQASMIDVWSKPAEGPLKDQRVSDLEKAMIRIYRRQAVLSPFETALQVKKMSVEERSAQILQLLGQRALVSFSQLCAQMSDLSGIVTTFLSILELLHDGKIDTLSQVQADQMLAGLSSARAKPEAENDEDVTNPETNKSEGEIGSQPAASQPADEEDKENNIWICLTSRSQ